MFGNVSRVDARLVALQDQQPTRVEAGVVNEKSCLVSDDDEVLEQNLRSDHHSMCGATDASVNKVKFGCFREAIADNR